MRTITILMFAAAIALCQPADGAVKESPESGQVSVRTADGTRTRGYTNPIVKGFHPDPSVCAVGEDYYLVNSSFQYFPGVPLFHSRDLVNWEQIGNVLTRRSQLELDGALCWGGIYAPTIRYNDGTFYMITTNVSHGGNFIVHTEDPAGEWSDPVSVDIGGIDPSLYFENGRCWYTGTCDSWIVLCEIDPMTGEKKSEVRNIWQGTGGRYPEGPHIYRKDGWYYLLIAEGGTEYAHNITIARSRTIDGPYEGDPDNPILTHCSMKAQGNVIQGIGHGDLVQASDGSWWMTCLGFRTQGGSFHLMGRETFMVPVEWNEGGWPAVEGGEIFLNMDVPTLPQAAPVPVRKSLDFSKDTTGPEWVHIRNPFSENYVRTGKALRLKSAGSLDEMKTSPTFIGRRQEDTDFKAVTSLEVSRGAEGGLSVYMDADSRYDIFLKGGKEPKLCLRYRLGVLTHTEEFPAAAGRIWLRVEGNEYFYVFSWSDDGENFRTLGQMNAKYLSTEASGGFTGIVLGLFAAGEPESYADFRTFSYLP